MVKILAVVFFVSSCDIGKQALGIFASFVKAPSCPVSRPISLTFHTITPL